MKETAGGKSKSKFNFANFFADMVPEKKKKNQPHDGYIT